MTRDLAPRRRVGVKAGVRPNSRTYTRRMYRADMANGRAHSWPVPHKGPLEGVKNGLPINAFVIGNGSEDAVQCTDSQRLVCGNGHAVRSWLLRLQDNVTPDLVDLGIASMHAEYGNEV